MNNHIIYLRVRPGLEIRTPVYGRHLYLRKRGDRKSHPVYVLHDDLRRKLAAEPGPRTVPCAALAARPIGRRPVFFFGRIHIRFRHRITSSVTEALWFVHIRLTTIHSIVLTGLTAIMHLSSFLSMTSGVLSVSSHLTA